MKICVTGATGFVGSALVELLSSISKYKVSAVSRKMRNNFDSTVKVINLADIGMSSRINVYFQTRATCIHAYVTIYYVLFEKLNLSAYGNVRTKP